MKQHSETITHVRIPKPNERLRFTSPRSTTLEAPISAMDNATQSLLAKWATEDAVMTEAEIKENQRIYAEIERSGIPRMQV